ncbi:magnesium transporter [Terasakiella pusilla]|uniref:magnesium transporter n=1 Tax=Terasakiella pusilla TaxID=64973 RepID=UPI003AA86E68
MTEKPETQMEEDNTVQPDVEIEEGDAFGLGEEHLFQLQEHLREGDEVAVKELFGDLHYADAADILQQLKSEDRTQVYQIVGEDFDPDIISELDGDILEEVVEEMGASQVAQALIEMDSDDALTVIEELDEEDQKEVLDALPLGERSIILEGLSFPEDSAGRLMQRDLVTVPAFWTVGETLDYLRSDVDLPDDFYEIFVVDPKFNPLGTVQLSKLMRSKRPVRIGNLMEEQLTTIPVETDQEEVAFIFRDRDLVSAPVVDEDARLLGVITVDDVLDVIDEEHEEDIMRMGGVTQAEFYSSALDAAKSRIWWLVVNLGTAILASLVIGMFSATIEQLVALAVLMPIVASMGGNAGTQTLTIAVRAIAMNELTPANAIRVVGKEVLVGTVNGIIFAVLIGLATWAWFSDPALAGVIAAAMVVNMIVAGLAGALIPVALDRFGADPAISSSVFLTTVTDVVGFFAFLGLAALLLL